VLPTGASVTAAQAGGRLVTKSSLQVTGATSVTDLIVKQRIESLIAAAFCSLTVTVQAQVYNGTGGSITPKLTVNRPGAQDNYGTVTADVNAVSLQACAASAWTLVAYTFSANAASYNGLEIVFDFGNNFGANTKTVQLTELDIRVTPSAATGLNSTPPPPELRLVASELPFCQRYYYQLGGIAAYQRFALGGLFNSSTSFYGLVSFAVPMRAAPTVSFTSAGTFASYDGVTLLTATAVVAEDINIVNFGMAATVSGATQYRPGFLVANNTLSAFVYASAEL
jgi:hypothetical protein